MSEPALKCENYAIFKQNYTQKLFISFKISYYCCFGLRGNLEFPDFLQKKFYNINYWTVAQADFCISEYFYFCKNAVSHCISVVDYGESELALSAFGEEWFK